MSCVVRHLTAIVAIVSLCQLSPLDAQTTPTAPVSDPLPGLPKPAELPGSLFAQPTPLPAAPALPGPYFEDAPYFDRPGLPTVGWFLEADLGLVGPHVSNQVTDDALKVGKNAPDFVRLPSAPLAWTVSPAFRLSRGLESGFGELSIAYRFMNSSGSGTFTTPDGTFPLTSRLSVNTIDFDYTSKEYSLWPLWDMKWRFGGRLGDIFFDSQYTEPFGVAARGTGIIGQRTSNLFVGFGPHWGLELDRRLNDTGLFLVSNVDGWVSIGRITQDFVEERTTGGAGGGPATGSAVFNSAQAVPSLDLQFGLGWRPPSWPNAAFFVGYRFEQMWNTGKFSKTPDSRGDLYDQGVIFKAEIHF